MIKNKDYNLKGKFKFLVMTYKRNQRAACGRGLGILDLCFFTGADVEEANEREYLAFRL